MGEEKETICRIETCEFQRVADGEFEVGLLLNEGSMGIIDKFGKQTGQVWNWHRLSVFALNIDLQHLENDTKPQPQPKRVPE